MAESFPDQEFLEYVVKNLVDNPEAVKVGRVVDQMGVLLTLDIDPQDMGKVIGRMGNTAKAVRTLLRVVGMKNDARRSQRTRVLTPIATATSRSHPKCKLGIAAY